MNSAANAVSRPCCSRESIRMDCVSAPTRSRSTRCIRFRSSCSSVAEGWRVAASLIRSQVLRKYAVSSASSSSVASSALVRRMNPPAALPSVVAVNCSNRWRKASRCAGGIFCETPMWLSCGRSTSRRPAMLICAVRRAPLVPIGSLSTCTISAWPSKIWRSIGSTGLGVSSLPLAPGAGAVGSDSAGTGAFARGAACLAAMLGMRSATCRKAARSSPMSMKADCMPGSTRDTLPR